MARPKKGHSLADKIQEEVAAKEQVTIEIPENRPLKISKVKVEVLNWELSIKDHKKGDVVELERSHADTLAAFGFVKIV